MKKKSFKPKARILSLLGEELIKSPVLAIYELVKNSYDADSTKVMVDFKNSHDIDNAVITIEDDGLGIIESVLENVWLEPGSDFRKPSNIDNIDMLRSHIYKRVPLGEKGIGRFAVHKIANKIKVITRPKNLLMDIKTKDIDKEILEDYEIELEIDWGIFSQEKYLNDINIIWKVKDNKDDFYFKNSSGTFIELKDLKEAWSRGMARNLKRNFISMTGLTLDKSNFDIQLDFNNNWLNGMSEIKDIIEEAPYKFTAYIDDKYNLEYTYNFNPKYNDTIGQREKEENKSIKGQTLKFIKEWMKKEEYNEDDIVEYISILEESKVPFGGIHFDIYSYDLDKFSLKDTSVNSAVIRDFLKNSAGFKVYKDNMRIFNYGEPGNDWLGLDIKRISNPAGKISNNQNLGYILLDASKSKSLIEKTNREGFIEDHTYTLFKYIVLTVLKEFQIERQKDRVKWKEYNNSASGSSVGNKLEEILKFLEKINFEENKQKEKLVGSLKSFYSKYEDEKKTLLLPAGIGLTMSSTIHELEKFSGRFGDFVSNIDCENKKLKEYHWELNDYVNNLTSVIQKSGYKKEDANNLINKAINNYKFKLKKYNVTCEVQNTLSDICCERRFIISVLMNLIENSIYWLDTINSSKKYILIKAFEDAENQKIVIVDNGPGFNQSDNITDLVSPLFTRKDDGMGLGLYIADTVMLNHGKLNIYKNMDKHIEYNIDESFNGACVELVFNKKDKCKD